MQIEPTPQDYIAALEVQRNAALNEVVNLRAEVAALRREVERLTQDSAESPAAE